MTPEREHNILDRSLVMEQLKTPWGPLNKRTSQDVLAKIGQETGMFKVPRILTFEEATEKAIKVAKALELEPGNLPLMRSFLHNPIADNLLCGFLDTLTMSSRCRYFKFYEDLIEQYSERQPLVEPYFNQMGFPSEQVGEFGIFFQEHIRGPKTLSLSVLDTADGAYVELVPHGKQRVFKSSFLYRQDKLYCRFGSNTENFKTLITTAEECFFRHKLIRDRFYQNKPSEGQFPLITEWVFDESEQDCGWYVVQLRASLVNRPYSFRLVSKSHPDLDTRDTYKELNVVHVDFNATKEVINNLIGAKANYCLFVEWPSSIKTPLGVNFGKPKKIELVEFKATAIMDHNLFSIVQVVHALGGEIVIHDIELGDFHYTP